MRGVRGVKGVRGVRGVICDVRLVDYMSFDHMSIVEMLRHQP